MNMSNNKYPYIGESKLVGKKVLFHADNHGIYLDGENCEIGNNRKNWNEAAFNSITLDYLTNTYGKCESQEHADFICKLYKNAGFNVVNDYNSDKWDYFSCNETILAFHSKEVACDDGERLIHLPLPPKKDKEMPEDKPVYTKEMHERGELPPVGSNFIMEDVPSHCSWRMFSGLVCKVIALTEFEGGTVVTFSNEKEGVCALFHSNAMLPIQTIKDDLIEFLNCGKGLKSIIIAKGLLEKYNITPKDS
jgi:hypothetical protein